MPDLFCFDVDGTLEVSVHHTDTSKKGVVRIKTLMDLKRKGNYIIIVSNSDAGKVLWDSPVAIFDGIPSEAGGDRPILQPWGADARTNALMAAKRKYKDAGWCYYISDNLKDDERAAMAGFVFMHPTEFVMKYQED